MKLRRAWGWIKRSPLRLTVFVIATALVIVALIPTVITWAPHWLASTGGLDANQRAEEVGRTRTALLVLLAGGIALVGAIYTALTYSLNRQAHELDRQGQITERFTRAVDQLGNAQVDVRLGGIYALGRLARESSEDYGPILEILTAYVRVHAPFPPRASAKPEDSEQPAADAVARDSDEQGDVEPTTDVEAILTVLRRLTIDTRRHYRRLDLRRTALSGADLVLANLALADLRKANLAGANLNQAKLEHANLEKTILMDAIVREAFLRDANLEGARLQGADLEGADLRGARLVRANLQRANLWAADLEGADLQDADYDPETRWPEGFEPRPRHAPLEAD